MRVKAKVNINFNGKWKQPGDVFEISTTDEDVLEYVELVETPIRAEVETVEGKPQDVVQKKRGRPKKA